MTLKEAIDIKARTGQEFLDTDPDELEEADRLSIEALKRIKRARDFGCFAAVNALPGETED